MSETTLPLRTPIGRFLVAVVSALVLAAVCAFSAVVLQPAAAFAATHEQAWTVEFLGDRMNDEGSADIVKTLSQMQPGDEAEFKVTLYENWDKSADWYMRNKVLSSMEESLNNANDRSGGSYSYELTYLAPNGEKKVLLSNMTVSGDAGSGETQGLFDATTATGEYFFLDTLAPKAKAQVTLYVAIDGETHGNTYFDTDARIQLSFAAEPSDAPGTSGDPTEETKKPDQSKKTTETDKTDKSQNKLSQTGDMVAFGIIALVAVAAVALIVALLARRRKTQKEGEEDDAQ